MSYLWGPGGPLCMTPSSFWAPPGTQPHHREHRHLRERWAPGGALVRNRYKLVSITMDNYG